MGKMEIFVVSRGSDDDDREKFTLKESENMGDHL